MCIYICIYIYMCVYMCIYIYTMSIEPCHLERVSDQGAVGDHETPMLSSSWMLTKDWVLRPGNGVTPYGNGHGKSGMTKSFN